MATSFNNLPQQIDLLIEEVTQIKKALQHTTGKNELEPKYLNLSAALKMLSEQGYKMSKSRMYKMTANGCSIPFKRFGNRIVFEKDELVLWCEKQISGSHLHNANVMEIVKSAQKMTGSNLKK